MGAWLRLGAQCDRTDAGRAYTMPCAGENAQRHERSRSWCLEVEKLGCKSTSAPVGESEKADEVGLSGQPLLGANLQG